MTEEKNYTDIIRIFKIFTINFYNLQIFPTLHWISPFFYYFHDTRQGSLFGAVFII